MTAEAQYRRGNLREALLHRAMVVLRDRGMDALSLRELARDVGVSHAAPARHFADRRRLLDALAVEGFELLADRMRDAVSSADDPAARARRAADAYIAFATAEGNLMEVMYRHDTARDAEAIGRGAAVAFAPILELFQAQVREDATSTATVFLAAVQGIAALVNCGVVPPERIPHLLDDAIPRFIASGEKSA